MLGDRLPDGSGVGVEHFLPGQDSVFGGRGGDLVTGNVGPANLRGGEGGDVLCGGPAADLIDGGRGSHPDIADGDGTSVTRS